MGNPRVDEDMEPEDQEPEVEKVAFWNRIFGGGRVTGTKHHFDSYLDDICIILTIICMMKADILQLVWAV